MFSVIGVDGQVYGPVDMQTLQRWCQEGRITPDSNLIDSRDGRVLSAQHIPQLSGFFQATQTYMPPHSGSPYGPTFSQGPLPQNAYQRYPVNGFPMVTSKTKLTAILLAFFLGVFGAHRFYLGHTTTAVLMLALTLVTCVFSGGALTGIWALIDIVLIATGALKDISGAELR